jgi:hypothetical protein
MTVSNFKYKFTNDENILKFCENGEATNLVLFEKKFILTTGRKSGGRRIISEESPDTVEQDGR